jgi:hypothetical protein
VEPENRLVARTLERQWEEALSAEEELRREYERFLSQQPACLSAEEREAMTQKKLTTTMNQHAYKGLRRAIGRKNKSQFIESPGRPYILERDLEAVCQFMAQKEFREPEALEWAEAPIFDQ